jgi:DNA repair protein RadD
MAAGERDRIIGDFKTGRIRFLFNANLLTTGFDAPHIDCIIMLRPTKSTGLYVQIMGRGLRKHQDKENTLVLDFAGNIERHGPIDQIRVKRKGEKGDSVSVAPVKECPDCHELLATMVMVCPQCGHEFPRQAPHGTEASEAVLVAALAQPKVYAVDSVEYETHHKAGKDPSLKVTYWCGPSSFVEWVPIEDERHFVRKHAIYWFYKRKLACPDTVEKALAMIDKIPAPDTITVKLDGKYWRVIDCDMGSSRMNISQKVGSYLLMGRAA